MKYTNQLNLPLYIFDWLVNDDYDHSMNPYAISATTLMKPTRASILTKRYVNQLQQDVSSLVASRLGTAIHDSIEKIQTPGIVKETRVSRSILLGETLFNITGKPDIQVDNYDGTWTLRDIKTTSVWSYVYRGKDEDYRLQLSIYRWLLSASKQMRDEGYIDFFFTDWQSSKARQDPQYPQQRIYPGYEIKLLPLDVTENYILGRLEELEQSRDVPDDDLPLCTMDELWADPETFAVTKHKAKRATKLCTTEAEAKDYMKQRKIAGYIERRPPKVKRCKYCAGYEVCSQRKAFTEQGLLT